jgi:hypothetical protein
MVITNGKPDSHFVGKNYHSNTRRSGYQIVIVHCILLQGIDIENTYFYHNTVMIRIPDQSGIWMLNLRPVQYLDAQFASGC